MRVRDMTWRAPVTIVADATISAAATLLAEQGVGALVVVDGAVPIGIVTDRDIVVRGIAKGVPCDGRIDSLMSTGVIALDADEEAEELFGVFSRYAIRRIPIVEGAAVVGMVTLDDAMVSTVGMLSDVVGTLAAQIAFPFARDEPPTPVVVENP